MELLRDMWPYIYEIPPQKLNHVPPHLHTYKRPPPENPPIFFFFADVGLPRCDIWYLHPTPLAVNLKIYSPKLRFGVLFLLILPKTLGHEAIIIVIRNKF